MIEKHPLQPGDWKSGTHADRFARVRHLFAGRSVLDVGAGSGVSNFVYRVGGRPRVNKGHTCWYDEVTLSQLLGRHGFSMAEISYVGHRTPGSVRALVAGAIRAVLPRHLAHNTLMVAARRAE